MGIELDARDVLAIARELEHRGMLFYRMAAEQAEEEGSRQLFEELAEMEEQHEQTFQGLGLKWGLRQNSVMDETSPQWNLVTKTFLGGLQKDLFSRFANVVGQVDILREAMAFEKDTISLLLSLKGMLPSPDERSLIDDLIKEELGHLIQLGSRLASADLKPWRRTELFSPGDVPPA